ncbi:MAG: hypothetical protein Q9174_007374, partial [Haloplaca sp. 1 TL-2023]
SEYEQAWFDQIEFAQTNICNVVAQPENAEASTKLVKRTMELTSLDTSHKFTGSEAFPSAALNETDKMMSRMHYNRTCYDSKTETFKQVEGKGIQLIEPLWGMLRDPFDKWCEGQSLKMDNPPEANGQSKAHIMPQGYAPYWYTLANEDPKEASGWTSHGLPPWHTSLRPSKHQNDFVSFASPQSIHIDLGSSYFGKWTADASASSGQWFYDTYHARGPSFDRFIAVELEVLDDNIAFEQLPPDLVGVYTLMNVGLSMDKGNKLNVIDMIKRVVKPEDFFVFKLDIDGAGIEEPIVKSLLEDDPNNGGASGLVDEL